MSFSLPDLFSIDHQIVEIMREAVSSTELLHERAMERFYRAVAVEEAVDEAKRKARNERAASESGSRRDSDNSDRYALFEHRTSIRRKLSNSGAHAASWQAKRERRRSSESQTDTLRVPFKLPASATLQDVASDPNLASQGMIVSKTEPWTTADDTEQLRRWHESGMNLSAEKTISTRIETHSDGVEIFSKQEDDTMKKYHMGIVETQSVETSIESSEEESSDEDLRQFRARIMAIPVVNEEDTYHPRGRPVPHVSPEPPPPVPPHKIPVLDITPPDRIQYSVPSPPISPTNIVPKSILKKRVEREEIPDNQFGRPIPPGKPIEIVQPQEDQGSVTLRKKSVPNLPDLTTDMILSRSDIDNENVISAAEVARNRRRQPKQLSKASITSSDGDEDKDDEKMAVVSHYTEIVKEYSMTHSPFPPRWVTPYSKNEDQIKNKEDSEKNKNFVKTAAARPFSPPRGRADYSSDEQSNMKVAAARTFSPPRGRPDYSSDEQSNMKAAAARTFSPPRGRADYSSDERTDTSKNKIRLKKKIEGEEYEKARQSRSRKNSVGSRSTTPSKAEKDAKKRSRPSSRRESPASRSRNVSSERGAASRSSSKNRKAASSENTGRKSVERSTTGRKSSRPSSRSSSRDRSRADTPTEVKMERLQRALEERKHRGRRTSRHEREINRNDNINNNPNYNHVLSIEAEKNVRSTVSYVTDVILLMAAVYVYLFKREILAIPIIGLLLYRQIQQGIRNLLPRWLRGPKR